MIDAILAAATVTPAERTFAQEVFYQFMPVAGALYHNYVRTSGSLLVAGIIVLLFGPHAVPDGPAKHFFAIGWPTKLNVRGNLRTAVQAAGMLIILVALGWIAHDHNFFNWPSPALSPH
jgi:hypothetical protein